MNGVCLTQEEQMIKRFFILIAGFISAYLIERLFIFINLYCYSKWGSAAFHASISIEVYIIMLIGYLSFKPIFSKDTKED